jgi:hypothetical protein
MGIKASCVGGVRGSLTLAPRAAAPAGTTGSAPPARPTCGRPSRGSATCTYEPAGPGGVTSASARPRRRLSRARNLGFWGSAEAAAPHV